MKAAKGLGILGLVWTLFSSMAVASDVAPRTVSTNRARGLAIQAAREKAIALAAELGQKIGKPRSIQEGGSGWSSGYGSSWGSRWGNYASQNVVQNGGAASSSEDGALALGQISVRASVSVTFELE